MRICIVKTSSLGDIVQALPVVDYLAARRPIAQVDWLVEAPYAPLVRAHARVGQVWELDRSSWKAVRALRAKLQEQRYDLIFDLQGNLKSALVLSQMRARTKVGFGWRSVPERISLLSTRIHIDPPVGRNRRDDYLYLVQSYLGDRVRWSHHKVTLQGSAVDQHPTVLLCPGSRWPTKQLALSQWEQFLEGVASMPVQWGLVWGTPQEEQLVQALHGGHPSQTRIIPKCRVDQLIGLLGRVRGVVSVDSFLLHLAGLMGVPTLSLFGPSSAATYAPPGSLHASVQGPCPYGVAFPRRCPKLRTCPTGACLKSLCPRSLADTFRTWYETNAIGYDQSATGVLGGGVL
jgi:heptosyltransferase I